MANLSKELTPSNIKIVIQRLNIPLNGGKADSNGWKTIKSPLRNEKNPSFGINIKTGAWYDHGTGESGDIVTLAERIKNINTKEAICWIKKQTDFTARLYQPPRKGAFNKKKLEKREWNLTPERVLLLSEAQDRLMNEPEHEVIKQANEYDCLTIETLKFFGVGLIEKWQQEWLVFPYKTGCQLYRRVNGLKVIRSLKGSSPGKSFFGSHKVTGNKESLLIAKSPREAMLIWQEYRSHVDVVGLATGEQGNLSNDQWSWLTSQISEANYSKIQILLDCDTEDASQTAISLTQEIKEVTI